MMTMKDFQKIADVLNDSIEDMSPPVIPGSSEFRGGQAYMLASVARSMADMLQKDNPRFDRAKFLTACGLS
jgi:hypothetical protein